MDVGRLREHGYAFARYLYYDGHRDGGCEYDTVTPWQRLTADD